MNDVFPHCFLPRNLLPFPLNPSPSKTAPVRTYHILDDDKFILSTESCHCPGVERDLMKAWARTERTAHDMIADVNSWSVDW